MNNKTIGSIFAAVAASITINTAFAAVPFKLGVAGYTFCKEGLDQGLSILQKIDCHYLCHKDFFLPYDASDGEIAVFKAKLSAAGVECTATGPLYAADEATIRRQFEFAKKLGVRTLVGVPYAVKPGEKDAWGPNRLESDALLDVIEKLVKEYDMVYAIHNHGPDIPDLYPTAEAVWKRIEKRDRRIGFCFDIGHQRRAGDDPAEAIRRYGERIYDVHVKNILLKKDAKGFAGNFAVPGPRGDLDIPAIFKALAEVGYRGVCHIEYEEGFTDNAMQLAESVGYYRGVMDAIHVKAAMRPVPEGANTLTAAEKAEGYELLFDGKSLPFGKWVGVKSGCRTFPDHGWFVKDGCLTMRPMYGIKDGNWFPLTPEDQKLGGGGDIVTVKKFRDFVFKFDFRLTEAGNSGVKYYYDEMTDKASCEEYQVLDEAHPDYVKGRDGNRRTAALYDLFPAPEAAKALKPVGEWNSGEIRAKGTKVEHWLNGAKVLAYDRASPEFAKTVEISKYATWGCDSDGKVRPWGRNAEGRLLLQDHGDSTVSFCNLKVRDH